MKRLMIMAKGLDTDLATDFITYAVASVFFVGFEFSILISICVQETADNISRDFTLENR